VGLAIISLCVAKSCGAFAQIWGRITSVSGFFRSYIGVQPLGRVLLRVLRGKHRGRDLLRGHHALPLPCLRGKIQIALQQQISNTYYSSAARKRKAL
jgi:hypothetical protein